MAVRAGIPGGAWPRVPAAVSRAEAARVPGQGAPSRMAGRASSRTPSNRVTHMAETDTDSSKLAPDVLVGEIERTRAQISQIDPLIGGAVALAAVSVTCYLLWRRLRK